MVADMGSRVLSFTLFMILVHYPTSGNVTTPAASLQEHVKQLDEMLAEIQSHAQAQEQKNSAVLSSVLSQLTHTTDELGDIRKSQNETIHKLDMKDAELSELWVSHNATNSKLEEKDAELSELWASYNATVLELQELNAKHNNVVMEYEKTTSMLDELKLKPKHNGYIGFHVRLSKGELVKSNEQINFDSIVYDTGALYDQTTGKFLVQVNGTYLVWIDITYQQPAKDVGFIMKTQTHVIEKAFGSKSDPHGTTSTIGMHYLQQGESIWVSPSQNVFLSDYFCNFGAVLLNAH